MATRILSGMLLLPLLLIVFIKGIPLYLASLILTIIAIKELTNALKVKNLDAYPGLGYALAIVVFLKNLVGLDTYMAMAISAIFICLVMIYILKVRKSILNLSKYLLGIGYVILGFDAVVAITSNFSNGDKYVWLIFIIALLSDTMAYFIGSMFGKHKLAPKLSPKKTIEGSIGAIVFSATGCVIFGMAFNLSPIAMIVVGSLGSVISQIGDLIASFVKRYVGIKDYGNLIPGHGGILDRFDSVILVSQFIYLVLLIKIF